MKGASIFNIILGLQFLLVSVSHAFHHEASSIDFIEYSPDVVEGHKTKKKPFFLLFSAEWCHWCKVFDEKTLSDERVAAFLNANFINIFIDADIQSSAYKKYKATGLPYILFLNPDESLYFKYAGTLYADNFLQVLDDVHQSILAGQSIYEKRETPKIYIPPKELNIATLESLIRQFQNGVLDNFDLKEYGLGQNNKTIFPRTFHYLVDSLEAEDRIYALSLIKKTVHSGIDHLHDKIEGGFFRYAEKRDWQIPHYEKQADLNAAIALLLYQLDREDSTPEFKGAADRTIGYLTSTLFDQTTGAFLNFQEADTFYYYLNKNRRKEAEHPKVMKNIIVDRLALTLISLIDVLDYTEKFGLRKKIIASLEFLSTMLLEYGQPLHFYSLADERWSGKGELSDYATLAALFSIAATKLNNDRYLEVATRVLESVTERFYDKTRRIYLDPEFSATEDLEYMMEMNGWISLALLTTPRHALLSSLPDAKSIIAYFSGVSELLEDRLWDASEWKFIESYIPYLVAGEQTVNKLKDR